MANEIGNTELSATKQTVITEIAQRALIAQSVLMPTFRNLSQYAGKGYKSISFPKNSSLFTVENRASETAGTNQQPAFAVDTLDLDVRAHIQWLVDSDDEMQSSLNVQQELIVRASAAHAADFDARAIVKMEAAGITTTTAGVITQAIFLEMRKVLLTNKANPANLWFACSPASEALLLKIDPFVSAQQYGSAIVPSGVLGTLYGVKVVMSPQLGADQFFMYENDGFGYALSRGPAYDEVKSPNFGVGAVLSVLAQTYGQKALQIAVPGAFKADGSTALGAAESGLIVKDNN